MFFTFIGSSRWGETRKCIDICAAHTESQVDDGVFFFKKIYNQTQIAPWDFIALFFFFYYLPMLFFFSPSITLLFISIR